MNPLHATIEEFAAEDYTHVECSARDAACGVVATATRLAEELESLDPPLLSDDAVKRHAQRFTDQLPADASSGQPLATWPWPGPVCALPVSVALLLPAFLLNRCRYGRL